MPHKDPEVRKAYMQKWVKKNRERLRTYHARYRNTPDQIEKRRDYWRKKNYGLSFVQWRWLFDQQAGLCAICQTKEAVFVDHNHMTGKVRGLLCAGCNTAIGIFNESADLLDRAKLYIAERKNGVEIPENLVPEELPDLWGDKEAQPTGSVGFN